MTKVTISNTYKNALFLCRFPTVESCIHANLAKVYIAIMVDKAVEAR